MTSNVLCDMMRHLLPHDTHNMTSTTTNAAYKVKMHTTMPQSAAQSPKLFVPVWALYMFEPVLSVVMLLS